MNSEKKIMDSISEKNDMDIEEELLMDIMSEDIFMDSTYDKAARAVADEHRKREAAKSGYVIGFMISFLLIFGFMRLTKIVLPLWFILPIMFLIATITEKIIMKSYPRL